MEGRRKTHIWNLAVTKWCEHTILFALWLSKVSTWGVNKTHEGRGGTFWSKPELLFKIRSLKSCCLKEAFIRNNQSLIIINQRCIRQRTSSHRRCHILKCPSEGRWTEWTDGFNEREEGWPEATCIPRLAHSVNPSDLNGVSWCPEHGETRAGELRRVLASWEVEMMKMLQGNNHPTGGC